jgi:hypothetical protein
VHEDEGAAEVGAEGKKKGLEYLVQKRSIQKNAANRLMILVL